MSSKKYLMLKFGHMIQYYIKNICDALRNLEPYVQLKKREKHPWRSVYFSKVVGFSLQLKLTLLHGCFSRFKIVRMVPNRATHHI